MGTWQPPIPSGALYSKPARQLGAGVALLGYCYDMVGMDGWFNLNLHEAAVVMDAPYPTAKFWWGLLKASGILVEIIDRGRHGIRARFDNYWLDWRILQARQATSPTPPPATPQSGDIREINGSFSGQSTIPNGDAYKVLHDDQESCSVASQPAARAPRRARDPTPHQALMAGYAEWLGYKIPNGAKEAAAAKRLLTAGYTLPQVDQAYHALKARGFYADKHLSLQTVYEQIGAILAAPTQQEAPNGSNGHYRPGRGRGGAAEPVRGGPSHDAQFKAYLDETVALYGDAPDRDGV